MCVSFLDFGTEWREIQVLVGTLRSTDQRDYPNTVSVIDLNCTAHLHKEWEVGEWWGPRQRTLTLSYLYIV